MNTHTTTQGTIAPGSAFAEIGTITHEGREYAACGAYITDDRLVAYLHRPPEPGPYRRPRIGDRGDVQTWDGTRIGDYVVSGVWSTPRSHTSSTRESVRIRLTDGRRYTGRSFGAGMIVHAKRASGRRR